MAPITIRKPGDVSASTPTSPTSQSATLSTTRTAPPTPTQPPKALSATSIPFSTLSLSSIGAKAFVPSPHPTPPIISAASAAFVPPQEFVPRLQSALGGGGPGGGGGGGAAGSEPVSRADTPLSEDLPFFAPQGHPVHHQQPPPPPPSNQQQQQLHAHQHPPQHPSHLGQQQQTFSQHDHADPAAYGAYHPHQPPPQQQQPYYGNHQPLQYHLYHPPPLQPPHQSFFLPSSLHQLLSQKSEATATPPDPNLPAEVGGYVGLVGVEKAPGLIGAGAGGGGLRTWVYKAWNAEGRAVCLRRIEGFRMQHESALSGIEKWTRVRHPSVVSLREAFTTRAFGDQSLVFVTDYHPISTTLFSLHLSPTPWSQTPPSPRSRTGGVTERLLWSYVVQLSLGLKAVHGAGLAVRGLEANRCLVTGKNRVRIGGGGVGDVLGWDGGAVAGHQQDDLLAFGKLILALACGSPAAVTNLPKAVDLISRAYSPELKNLILYLLSKPGGRKSIDEVLGLISARVAEELAASLVAEDTLETSLSRELENGRLVRLVAKLGFINERPEFDHDPRWAETGDRYIIKLFRDWVFHQVDENGRPVTDLSHVLVALNKLDAGVDEKLMLVSRDEQSCLIVTYREVKNCIESAFLDLSR